MANSQYRNAVASGSRSLVDLVVTQTRRYRVSVLTVLPLRCFDVSVRALFLTVSLIRLNSSYR